MFKDRRFLIGLGAGMMIGSLLLQLTLIGERAAEPLTEAELRREAERAGYELIPQGAMADGTPEGGGAAQPPTPPASSGAPSKEEGAEKKAAGGSGQDANPASSAAKKQDPPPAEKKQAPPLTEVKQEAKIKVAYGSGSRAIAKQLADAGIVESAEEFERYVAKQKKQGKLRTGTFLFPVPSTMEEALRILTSKPNG